MDNSKTANKAAKSAVLDEGETIGLMDPMLVGESSQHRTGLTDIAIELAARSAGFRRSLPDAVLTALADLVRAMNCYYSNLIEGHNTHPIDIERALKNDYSTDPRKRDLQLEAKAHITVQQWIDEEGLEQNVTTMDSLREIHCRFYELLPEDMIWSEEPDTGERLRIVPGALRQRHVKVGRHISVSPGALRRFMDRFEQAYANLGKTDMILAAAAAHHRLLWIHPFLDGNGRVSRLMSYAMLRDTLDTGGVWSIARGLARNETEYKRQLMDCDQERHNHLDGRGTFSEGALAEFTRFFLTTCIDQVVFMENLLQPTRLRDRIRIWIEEEIRAGTLPPKSGVVMEAALYRGELLRGDVTSILGTSKRQARRVTSALIAHGVLISKSSRAPLRLAFPARLAERWMPGLFPASS